MSIPVRLDNGVDLVDACVQLIEISQRLGCCVECNYNDVFVSVGVNASLGDLISKLRERLASRSMNKVVAV